jgi:hypothetical protein
MRPGALAGMIERMESSKVLSQLDSLIDELLNDGDVSSSSLASILMAARDSVRDGYHVAMARRTWNANNDLKGRRRTKGQYRLDVPSLD